MMFSVVIPFIVFTRVPYDVKLVLFALVDDPILLHIESFCHCFISPVTIPQDVLLSVVISVGP